MSLHSLPQKDGGPPDSLDTEFMATYLDALTLVERLHRLLLDVIKDEFERVGVLLATTSRSWLKWAICTANAVKLTADQSVCD